MMFQNGRFMRIGRSVLLGRVLRGEQVDSDDVSFRKDIGFGFRERRRMRTAFLVATVGEREVFVAVFHRVTLMMLRRLLLMLCLLDCSEETVGGQAVQEEAAEELWHRLGRTGFVHCFDEHSASRTERGHDQHHEEVNRCKRKRKTDS